MVIEKLAYTVAEAAQATGLSRATLFRQMADDALPSRMVCGRRLIMADDLRTFLDTAASPGKASGSSPG